MGTSVTFGMGKHCADRQAMEVSSPTLNILAFSLNTDGVPLFKSSSTSFWPVYLVIHNLPPSIRMNSENIILCSVWCGSSKPPMHPLLQPLMKTVHELSTVGVQMSTPAGLKVVRGKLLFGVFDMPAKATVLDMKQFNCEYGCPTCLYPGLRLPNGSWIYQPENTVELRTDKSIRQNAQQAQTNGKAEYGVMRLSVLAPAIGLVEGIPVDYLYSVLEGMTKWLLHAWFDSKKHSEPFYLRRNIKAIDRVLLQQQPPHEFSHPPRSLQAHMNYFKASELRSWLLYYSLPLVLDYQPPLFFHHFVLFVCAVHILLQDSLTTIEITAAEHMINDFLELLPELYGERSCTADSPALSYIPKFVRLWGALWTHSTFGVESKSGHLKGMIHGKCHVLDQLVFAVDVSLTLQMAERSIVRE